MVAELRLNNPAGARAGFRANVTAQPSVELPQTQCEVPDAYILGPPVQHLQGLFTRESALSHQALQERNPLTGDHGTASSQKPEVVGSGHTVAAVVGRDQHGCRCHDIRRTRHPAPEAARPSYVPVRPSPSGSRTAVERRCHAVPTALIVVRTLTTMSR